MLLGLPQELESSAQAYYQSPPETFKHSSLSSQAQQLGFEVLSIKSPN